MFDPHSDVYNFQTNVLKNAYPEKPIFLQGEALNRTVVFFKEEISELQTATKISDQADAIIDLIYFAFGALHQMGVNTSRVWHEVHKANMTKKRGETKRGFDNDASKPDDWSPPDHSWLDE